MSTTLNISVYKRGVRQDTVPVGDIQSALANPDTFVWLGLHEPDELMLQSLKKELALHELAVEDAHRAYQRPKIETYPGSLFIVLHMVWLQDETVHFGETHLFVGKQFLVSVRHGTSRTYAQVREHIEAMPNRLAKGPSFAVYAILDYVVDNYKPVVDHYEDRLEQLEADIFLGKTDRDAIGRLYDLQRQLLALRRAVAPLRDVCGQLMSYQEEIIPAKMKIWFRDVDDHIIRLVAAIDNMLEKLAAAMQVSLAFITIHQNDVVKRLAGWGAILAVPAVLFSLYGMNFKYMPELDWSFGYPLILLVTGGTCAGLYWWLKRSGWL